MSQGQGWNLLINNGPQFRRLWQVHQIHVVFPKQPGQLGDAYDQSRGKGDRVKKNDECIWMGVGKKRDKGYD